MELLITPIHCGLITSCSGLIISLPHSLSERNLLDFRALTLAFASGSLALSSHSLGSTKGTKETTLGPGCVSTGEQISEISYFRSFSSLVSIGRDLLNNAVQRMAVITWLGSRVFLHYLITQVATGNAPLPIDKNGLNRLINACLTVHCIDTRANALERDVTFNEWKPSAIVTPKENIYYHRQSGAEGNICHRYVPAWPRTANEFTGRVQSYTTKQEP